MKTTLSLTMDHSQRLALWSEVARAALMVMEWLWLTNWYDLLVQPGASGVGVFLALGGVMISTHLLARGLNHFKVNMTWRRVIFAGWVLFLVFFTLRTMIYAHLELNVIELILRPMQAIGAMNDDMREFWHIMVILIFAWRAVSLARDEVGILSAQFSFQLGLVMMLFSGLGLGFIKPLQTVLSLYAFLFCALIAMSAARIHSLGDLRGGRMPLPGRQWALGIGLSALVIVGVGVFAGWSSSTWAADVVLGLYTLLFTLLIVLGLIVLSPVIAVIFWFSPTLREMLSTLLKGTFLSGLMEFLSSAANAIQNPPEWLVTGLQVGKPLLLGGIIVVVLVGLLFLLAWKPWQMRAIRDLGGSDLPFQPSILLPQFILKRLGERFTHGQRLLAAARVRWIYAQMMRLCASMGQPRPAAVTPTEFLPRLTEIFPDQTGQLRQITDAYLKVRYGMMPETQAEVDELMEGWKQLKQAGVPLVAEYKRKRKRGEIA